MARRQAAGRARAGQGRGRVQGADPAAVASPGGVQAASGAESGGGSPLDYIAGDLRPLATLIRDLREHPDNARRHTERDIPILAESLRRYGQRKPIVAKHEYRDMTNVVIAGNGTRTAAERMGWSHLAVSWFDGTDDEADEYALVDNRTAELSTWDLQILARQLRTVRERGGAETIERLGWAAHEAAPLLAAEWNAPTVGHLPGREVAWRSVSLSLGQWLVLELCIQRVQARENDPAMPEGRCVELIAAEFLGEPEPGGSR